MGCNLYQGHVHEHNFSPAPHLRYLARWCVIQYIWWLPFIRNCCSQCCNSKSIGYTVWTQLFFTIIHTAWHTVLVVYPVREGNCISWLHCKRRSLVNYREKHSILSEKSPLWLTNMPIGIKPHTWLTWMAKDKNVQTHSPNSKLHLPWTRCSENILWYCPMLLCKFSFYYCVRLEKIQQNSSDWLSCCAVGDYVDVRYGIALMAIVALLTTDRRAISLACYFYDICDFWVKIMQLCFSSAIASLV